jgi:hypothetical protein
LLQAAIDPIAEYSVSFAYPLLHQMIQPVCIESRGWLTPCMEKLPAGLGGGEVQDQFRVAFHERALAQ